MPKHDAFNRAHNRLTPVLIKTINDLVVATAVEAKLEDGNALRVDSTVVETNIPIGPPTPLYCGMPSAF